MKPTEALILYIMSMTEKQVNKIAKSLPQIKKQLNGNV